MDRDKTQDRPVAATEGLNPASLGLDTLNPGEILARMHAEDQRAVQAVGQALGEITKAVQDAVAAIKKGGRVFYAGAGTSGRLGVLDASEVPPTFSSRAFVAIMAGGTEAITESVEGAEDDSAEGARAAEALCDKDMAVGIAASGRTPYVLGFLQAARQRGARTWLMTCNPAADRGVAEGLIVLDTGAEIIAGSTRLKAGTATKLALNMLSTATMVQLGGTYDGHMVDVAPTNRKLVARAVALVATLAGVTETVAEECLTRSDMRPKTAALMAARGMEREAAAEALRRAGGSLRAALRLSL